VNFADRQPIVEKHIQKGPAVKCGKEGHDEGFGFAKSSNSLCAVWLNQSGVIYPTSFTTAPEKRSSLIFGKCCLQDRIFFKKPISEAKIKS
jgi:hypothetical protein